MRKLIWIVVIAAALWSGYWVLGSQGIERGFSHWLDLRRDEGWQAEMADISTTGFPLAFDMTVSEVSLVDPATGLGWQAPSFRVLAQTYSPTRARAIWPATQKLITPFETIDVTALKMEASLGLVPGPALALDTSEVALEDVSLTSSAGWSAALAEGSLQTARDPEDHLTQDIRFIARNLTPARIVLTALDPTGRLPEDISALDLDLRATFDAPWDRHAIEDRRPQPTALDLNLMRAVWGDMEIEAAGTLAVDQDGVPDGKVTVRAVNWREMLEIAEASGLLSPDMIPTVQSGLEILAGLSGNPETIDAPLTFRGGFILVGFIPIGPAPILRLR